MLTPFADDPAEAAGLAIQVRALLAGGVPAREIAILVRVNADTERFEQALGEAGVPYVVRGAERFYERPVVRQALVLLRGAARGADPGDALPAAVRDVLTGIGFSAAAVPGGGAAARERWESLAAIAQLADDLYAARPGATLGDFAAELTQRAELGPCPGGRRCDAGLDARGQGAGVGRGAAARPGRGADADRARQDGGGDRGGKAATVCRGDQGPRAPVPVLVAGPGAGPGCGPVAVAVPGRPAPVPARTVR